VATVRGLIGSLTFAGGALHLAVAPGRSADWRAEGITLASTGVVMVAVGLAVVLHRARALLIAASIVNAVVVAALVASRTAGYPFGPWSNTTPSMGPYEATVLVVAVIALAGDLRGRATDDLTSRATPSRSLAVQREREEERAMRHLGGQGGEVSTEKRSLPDCLPVPSAPSIAACGPYPCSLSA